MWVARVSSAAFEAHSRNVYVTPKLTTSLPPASTAVRAVLVVVPRPHECTKQLSNEAGPVVWAEPKWYALVSMVANTSGATSRLLHLISSARSKYSKGNSNTTKLRAVLADVLNVEEKHTPTMLRCHAALIDSCQDARLEVETLENVDHNLHLEPIVALEKALMSTSLTARWSDFEKHFGPIQHRGLRYTVDRLSGSATPGGVSDEALSELLKAVTELEGLTTKSDGITAEGRSALLGLLHRYRSSIQLYRIYGDGALESLFNESLGVLVRHGQDVQDEEVRAKQVDLLRRVNDCLSIAVNFQQLVTPVLRGLPGIGS